MASKRKSLGKGLDALLGAVNLAETVESDTLSPENQAETTSTDKSMTKLPVEFLTRGQYQPRREFDPEALEELAESIKNQGLLQPIVVRELGSERYEIIAGERRWRACQLAGLADIPVIIKAVDDETALALALIENIQREDLNAIEEGQALLRLQNEFQLSQQEVADSVGKSRSAVANLMRLTRLHPEVQTLLSRGDIDMGHARALLALEPLAQKELARKIVDASLNVRQTEKLVGNLVKPKTRSKSSAVKDPNISRLEEDLSQQLAAPVSIHHKGKGGKLEIRYTNLDVLEGILQRLKP